MATIAMKRVYDEPESSDGFRVLVDRLWPRGVAKEKAKIDLWFKEIAPSTDARKEFGHMADRFAEFTDVYRAELDTNPAVAQALELLKKHDLVTLVYAAKDEHINHVVVLRDYLLEQDGASRAA